MPSPSFGNAASRLCVALVVALAGCRAQESPAGTPPGTEAATRAGFSFVQLSDTLFEPHEGGAPPPAEPRAEVVFRWLERELKAPQNLWPGAPPAPPPSFVIVTGDLTAFGAPGTTWRSIEERFDRLGIPWHVTPGERDTTWMAPGQAMRRRYGAWNYSFDHGGLHFVGLLASSLGSSAPAFDATTLAWLHADLEAKGRAAGVVLFTHFAPDLDTLAQPAQLAQFESALDATHVELVLHGHGRTPAYRRVDDLDLIQGGATCGGGALDTSGYTLVSVQDGVLRAAYRYLDPARPPELLLEKKLAPPPVLSRFKLVRPKPDRTPESDVNVEVERDAIEPEVLLDGRPLELAWHRSPESVHAKLAKDELAFGAHLVAVRGHEADGTPRNRSAVFLVASPQVEVVWRSALGFAVASGPVVKHAGDFAVVASRSGRVVAVDTTTGEVAWTRQLDSEVVGSPCETGELVVVPTGSGNVVALAPGGKARWQTTIGVELYATPLQVEQVVYVGDNSGRLHALELTHGRKLWTYQRADYGIESAPALLGSLLVFGAWDGRVYAVERGSGALRWKEWGPSAALATEPGAARYVAPANCSPAIVGGRAFVCDAGGRVAAFDATGAREDLRLEGVTALGASPDGNLATLRCSDGRLVRVDATGRVLWQTQLEADRSAVAPVEALGRIHVVSERGLLSVLRASDGELLWSFQVTPRTFVLTAPAIASDGTVIVGALDGSLTALRGRGSR